MYEIFERLMNMNNVKPSDVSRGTGIPRSMFTDWKKGRTTPKADKIKKIADYFGVDISIFYNEVQISGQQKYYTNEATAKVAQELFDNPDLRALLNAARDCEPEVLQNLTTLLLSMKGTNPDG